VKKEIDIPSNAAFQSMDLRFFARKKYLLEQSI